MTDPQVRQGAGIYSKPVLNIYDLLVLKISNSLAWRCPSSTMLAQYDRLIGRRHLDIGPGTGWYLAHATLPTGAEITLMDLNENSLEHARGRLDARPSAGTRPAPALATGNVLEPLPAGLGPFDSIAANYLFHCVPGSWAEKGAAFEHLADRLADNGALFGATILGRGVTHNLGGRRLMALYNRIGVFHNTADDEAGLRAALESNFAEVKLDLVGTVALFSATMPQRRA